MQKRRWGGDKTSHPGQAARAAMKGLFYRKFLNKTRKGVADKTREKLLHGRGRGGDKT